MAGRAADPRGRQLFCTDGEFKDHLVRSRCPAAGLKTGPTAPIPFTTGPGSRPATVRLLLLCEAAAVPAAAAELLCSARP
ncbi:hypothetical protein [Kitasatospora cineracea]|uniref:Uncharacterized protein n=1 Tax=Kitasatospora cineracea TaxID=88074 RepID=A0A8G1UC07_9ACTN|nr:hypothetical protein [Kitasatospora cineracea]ROR35828.1 hypothetical protein EDD39_7492 [Kitasatospora cineracea]